MWNAPNFDGGQNVQDYRVWFDQGINSFAVLAENVVTLPFVATPVVMGNTYKFKVQARNSVGYSLFSEEFAVIAATVPSQPAQPTTSLTDNLLTVKWTQPAENGQVITSYMVYIKQANTAFSLLPGCDGSSYDVLVTQQCSTSVASLMASPFLLQPGASIIAKVSAQNSIGTSVESADGNGAFLRLSAVPDAPILTHQSEATTKTQIGLVWQDAAFDGGQPVQEYRVWTDQSTGTWKVLKTLNVKSLVVTGLTPGSRYSFKVQARNSIGYSVDSNTITALAAIVPSKPLSPSTYLQVNSVIAKWTAPTTNSL